MTDYPLNYRGIIIQNDDPQQMGRVKVWVPHVNLALYDKWNNVRDKDKMFTYPGANLSSSLTPEILLRLKTALPWAQVKQPIIGMGTSVTYNADQDHAEISNDSHQSNQATVINPNTAPTTPAQATPSIANRLAESNMLQKPAASTINNPVAATPSSSLGYMSSAASPAAPITPLITTTTTPIPQQNTDNVSVLITGHGGKASRIGVAFTSTSDDGLAPLSGKITGLSGATTGTQLFTFATPTLTTTTTKPPQLSQLSDNIEKVSISITGHGGRASRIGVMFSQTADDGSVPLNGKIAGLSGATKVNQTFNFSAPLTFSQGNDPNTKSIAMELVSANGQKVSTTAANVKYDGTNLVVDKNGNLITVPKAQITGINIAITDPNTVVNFSSSRLGTVSKLLGEYQSTPHNTVVTPPASISAPSNNLGGGGGDLFNLVNSSFLTPDAITKDTIGGVNPDSKQGSNYGRRLPPIVDPNKTKGINQTLPADSKPPMLGNTQGNKVKGSISIPGVGAHVSVYFENGDPLYPIVDGIFYTQEDFAGINDSSK